MFNFLKQKTIDKRIKSNWPVKKVNLDDLNALLAKDDIMELWCKYNDMYFQYGSSSEYDKSKGFFNKVYYINTKTDDNIFPLLNNQKQSLSFYMTSSIEEIVEIKIIDNKTLKEIWNDVEIVGAYLLDDYPIDNFVDYWALPDRD